MTHWVTLNMDKSVVFLKAPLLFLIYQLYAHTEIFQIVEFLTDKLYNDTVVNLSSNNVTPNMSTRLLILLL